MPFKDEFGNPLPTCEVDGVYKEWKAENAVRMVAVRSDPLFEPNKAKDSSGEPIGVKFNIKDSVHNQFVLNPMLQRMAQHQHHPLPYVKDVAQENLIRLQPVPMNMSAKLHSCTFHFILGQKQSQKITTGKGIFFGSEFGLELIGT
jgi:hypothetical protein